MFIFRQLRSDIIHICRCIIDQTTVRQAYSYLEVILINFNSRALFQAEGQSGRVTVSIFFVCLNFCMNVMVGQWVQFTYLHYNFNFFFDYCNITIFHFSSKINVNQLSTAGYDFARGLLHCGDEVALITSSAGC